MPSRISKFVCFSVQIVSLLSICGCPLPIHLNDKILRNKLPIHNCCFRSDLLKKKRSQACIRDNVL